MGRVGHKRQHKNIRDLSRKYRTRKRTRDLDQIHEDLKPLASHKLLNQAVDPDLPGCGQHYCLECSRYFIDQKSLGDHLRSKQHRRRLKELKDGPYTQKDAEIAAGLSTDNGQRSAAALERISKPEEVPADFKPQEPELIY
ncbi:hypothetical protein DSO57_1004120 [Entomophthora muscae]|uniref:Uncharacterized protein n=1 Tax=Entomophthora muscae TaxID=34485 RepID=A0ACC2TIX3_9FUNG|nr:hypothetical protein DSO57_1004120 [Entomophthora muscae]